MMDGFNAHILSDEASAGSVVVGTAPQTYDIGWLMNLISTSGNNTALTAEQFNEIKAAADAPKIFVGYGQVFSSSAYSYGGSTYITLTQSFANSVTIYSVSSLNGTYNARITSNQIITQDDLTGYAKASDVPKKTSQLTNDSGYLTEHQSLEEYYTKTQADTKLNDYALKTEIPSVPKNISQLKNDSNYINANSLF